MKASLVTFMVTVVFVTSVFSCAKMEKAETRRKMEIEEKRITKLLEKECYQRWENSNLQARFTTNRLCIVKTENGWINEKNVSISVK